MSNNGISAATATEATGLESAMYRVKLKSVVSLYGILFKPGQNITVDRTTLDKMGDAVEDVEQV